MEGCAEDGTRGLEELRKMGLPGKVLDQVGWNFGAVQLNSDLERWTTGSGLYGTNRNQTEKTVRQRLLKATINTSEYIFYRSTTVLNMTVTKVERVKQMGWERRRRRRTWSLRKINF